MWLPFAACVYAAFTGDEGIWDVQTSWLTGDPLTDEEQERYFAPSRTVYRSSLYIHAVRALDRACTAGAHGLPLIGSGDWNDGFNRLGAQGRGESVWLAMFLRMTLLRMALVCEARGETERAAQYRERAQAYRLAAEECFAGDRYLRAFDDEGRAVGREGEAACALDSLPQSFDAFSGMDPQNTAVALDTAFRLLADRESGTVQLFTPAFAEPDRAVGYTSAYPAGVRENGGQYTHAAVWLAMALLESGRAVQGRGVPRRAICARGGRLPQPRVPRPGRLDAVYRCGGLVPDGGFARPARPAPGRKTALPDAAAARGLARLFPAYHAAGNPAAHHRAVWADRADGGRRRSAGGAARRPSARGAGTGRQIRGAGAVNGKMQFRLSFLSRIWYTSLLEEFSEMR